MTPVKLTPSEVRVLRFYRSYKAERFCCSLKTIAKACRIEPRTVRRANARFRELNILTWVSGNSASWNPKSRGQANRYRLVLKGIEGSNVTPSTTRRLRFLTRRIVRNRLIA